jgi:hypothetical protein
MFTAPLPVPTPAAVPAPASAAEELLAPGAQHRLNSPFYNASLVCWKRLAGGGVAYAGQSACGDFLRPVVHMAGHCAWYGPSNGQR